ncbi:hypothetical protein JCM11491_000021 [Sporobolomyces phaffii]
MARPRRSIPVIPRSLSSPSALKPSPVVFAGSIQSMVSEKETLGADPAVIAGAIGGTFGALLVVLTGFFVFNLVRRWIRTEDDRRGSDDPLSRRRSTATLASSRPVSTFSDTTVDSSETRRTAGRKWRRRSSAAGVSLKSLRAREHTQPEGGRNSTELASGHAHSRSEPNLSQPFHSLVHAPTLGYPHVQPFASVTLPPPSQPAVHAGGHAATLRRGGMSLGQAGDSFVSMRGEMHPPRKTLAAEPY